MYVSVQIGFSVAQGKLKKLELNWPWIECKLCTHFYLWTS